MTTAREPGEGADGIGDALIVLRALHSETEEHGACDQGVAGIVLPWQVDGIPDGRGTGLAARATSSRFPSSAAWGGRLEK